jgi:group I intron endonuclease
MVIYLITNLINGRKYVGMDSNNNPKYLGSGTLILQALKKYGRENFKKEILEYCNSIQEMEEKETYWICKLNALKDPLFYNLEDNRKRGTDPFQNKTEEEKQAIYKKRGDKQKGISKVGNIKPKPPGFSEAQKERLKDKGPRGEESKLKQSISMKGKPQKQIIKNWSQSSESKTLKPILQFDKDGNFIREWDSIRHAQEHFKKDSFGKCSKYRNSGSHINNNLSGRTKTTHGFIWKYKN